MARNTATARTRRRGPELENAIYAATLAELDKVGYAGLTMEGVAARARTGKAALYRRWPSKQDLVIDALRRTLPDPHEPDPDRSTRDNLLTALTTMSEALAGNRSFPGIAVLGEVLREPDLRKAFIDTAIRPRLSGIVAILRHGEQRGEIVPSQPLALLARIGPALVLQSFMLTGRAPQRDEIATIVDDVLLSLLRRRP